MRKQVEKQRVAHRDTRMRKNTHLRRTLVEHGEHASAAAAAATAAAAIAARLVNAVARVQKREQLLVLTDGQNRLENGRIGQ